MKVSGISRLHRPVDKWFERRPWGWYWKLLHFSRFWLKFLFVHGRTSLQSHAERDEYVLGLYKVKRGEQHRMGHGIFIEVAVGEPSEDDIVRYEDDFNRI